MNKTFQINLGGCLFSIDDDAYNYINQYLSALKTHFSASESCDEILSDIEARMAELFTEMLAGRPIIGLKEAEEVVQIMGRPEDFGADPIETQTASSAATGSPGFSPAKRLYRDPDDKKLGGVCSGLSAFLGINDPLWLRLLFVILFFTWGLGFMTYLLLWILVPKASTSAEKLAMRGKPVTFDNIARVVEEDINDLGGKIEEGVKGTETAGVRAFLGNVLNLLTSILAMILGFLIKFFKVILIFIAVVLGLSLLASWVSTLVAMGMATNLLYYIGPEETWLTRVGVLSLNLLVGIPAIMLILWVLHFLFSYKINRLFSTAAFVVWIAAFITLFLATTVTFKEFASYGESTTTSEFKLPGKEVFINMPEEDFEEQDWNIVIGSFAVGPVRQENGLFLTDDVSFRIERSQDSLVHISKELSSRGKTKEEARTRALRILHDAQVDSNRITLPPTIQLPLDDKYRGQKVEYIISIPEGKTVYYEGQTRRRNKDLGAPLSIPPIPPIEE